jgi:hypothetical protein
MFQISIDISVASTLLGEITFCVAGHGHQRQPDSEITIENPQKV